MRTIRASSRLRTSSSGDTLMLNNAFGAVLQHPAFRRVTFRRDPTQPSPAGAWRGGMWITSASQPPSIIFSPSTARHSLLVPDISPLLSLPCRSCLRHPFVHLAVRSFWGHELSPSWTRRRIPRPRLPPARILRLPMLPIAPPWTRLVPLPRIQFYTLFFSFR